MKNQIYTNWKMNLEIFDFFRFGFNLGWSEIVETLKKRKHWADEIRDLDDLSGFSMMVG